jgi:hypothetical protein
MSEVVSDWQKDQAQEPITFFTDQVELEFQDQYGSHKRSSKTYFLPALGLPEHDPIWELVGEPSIGGLWRPPSWPTFLG